MADLSRSISRAPTYVQHREVAANDAVASTNVKQGLNCAGYDVANIQVIPSNGANPDVEVLFWSDAAAKFISASPAVTKNGVGVDTPYEFQISTGGRVIWVQVVTGITAGDDLVKIFVSGVAAPLAIV